MGLEIVKIQCKIHFTSKPDLGTTHCLNCPKDAENGFFGEFHIDIVIRKNIFFFSIEKNRVKVIILKQGVEVQLRITVLTLAPNLGTTHCLNCPKDAKNGFFGKFHIDIVIRKKYSTFFSIGKNNFGNENIFLKLEQTNW